jgi:hypothetical protein
MVIFVPPSNGDSIRKYFVASLSTLVLIAPLVLQPQYWNSKLPGTLFHEGRVTTSVGSIATHLASNFLYAVLSPLYIVEESHFISVSYADPLTAGLFFLGLAYLIRQRGRHRFATFVLLSLFFLLVVVGTTHDRKYPPNTRMFLVLPWIALLAAIGATWVAAQLRGLGLARRWMTVILGLLVVSLVSLNVYQAYPLSKQRLRSTYQSVQVVFARLAQEVFAAPELKSKGFVFLNDPRSVNVDSMRELLAIYGIAFDASRMREVIVRGPELSAAEQSLIADRNSLVFVNPFLDARWRQSYESVLRQAGKQPCRILTSAGDHRFTIWQAEMSIEQCDLAL